MTMTTTPATPTTTPTTAPALAGRLVPREQLTAAERAAMHALLDAHFDGVSAAQFERDLAEKNWIILLEQPGAGGAALRGFSTLLAYETVFRGEPVSVVYSGDTIVARDAWGTSALPRTWIASVNRLRQHYPRGRYYWMLITSGFRTYHFLPLFWREFFPRHDTPTPPDSRALSDHLAAERFGRHYDPAAGVVRFPEPQRLRGELAAVPENRLRDPHVAFFLSANPGHARGEELVCLTELSADNLTAAGRRMVRGR
jgi:hypothetical protein